MFQGIVQGTAKVDQIIDNPGLRTFWVEFENCHLQNIVLGASIAVDGVCLTVAGIESDDNRAKIKFDAMQETLDKTTLGMFKPGGYVNIERSAKFGDEIGGHELSGHVDTTAEIIKIENPENNHVITFKVSPEFSKFIFSKGYLAVNGASLTIAYPDKNQNTFQVFLIPETLRLTTFGSKKVGDMVNIEIDKRTQVIVETIERVMQSYLAKS